MMKWVMGVFVTLLAIGAITASAVSVFASDIRVRLDGEYVDIYPAPFIEDGRTIVPARAITEMLGAVVGWDDELRQVSIELGYIDIILTIDSNIAVINGIETELDVPARIVDETTIVPLRFVAESLSVAVEFCREVVVLSSPDWVPQESEREVHEKCECSIALNVMVENRRVWTIKELSEIIVASGHFWEEWWNVTGRFAFEHTGDWGYIYPYITIYVELLPTSGFENLNDIRYYLFQYYTETKVDAMLSASFPPFIEHNNVLYVHMVRACSMRPDWATAMHILINHDGCYASVDSVVPYWSDYPTETDDGLVFMHVFEVTHNFTFINGRIDFATLCPVWGW